MTDVMDPDMLAGMDTGETMEEMSGGLKAEVWARIEAHLGTVATELVASRERQLLLWHEVRFVPVNAEQVAFAALPFAFRVTCKTGYTWAVQRVTAAGFASGTDTLTIYRGASPSEAVPQNQVQVLSQSLSTWHPGRTGLLLKPNQTIVLGGGTSGSTYTVNLDVIQVADSQLPYFLL